MCLFCPQPSWEPPPTSRGIATHPIPTYSHNHTKQRRAVEVSLESRSSSLLLGKHHEADH